MADALDSGNDTLVEHSIKVKPSEKNARFYICRLSGILCLGFEFSLPSKNKETSI
jgi:hypothetical protein